ncbi:MULTISPECIES: TetR/AcrR family transcriptional regulator [Prauserella salsuginis group]|uniref:AcrR family transcriptional regulator n=2 Tax=Prauserella salsuginis group TaxID=2893672 RepID=A0A839XC04_9PSEU|nr:MULTISPECIES: TetR/AcrR family transcriptional regulator [Prauserella salsuginis group]MBB3661502.1 AcrR family transcriptional regulator [Prauserella sediminis]MCR3719421.1 transcriptional regulator, TetR family [Prauserella flava]MCR3735565.1 transcriptional regulator, TetR family [Prauserella salsuginis]
MPRPREFDEECVVAAIREVFWDKGYAATSVDDLMRASGLGKGSLYGAFGDKHRLFLRVLREYNDTNDRVLRERLASASRAVHFVREFVHGPSRDSTGASAQRGCLLANSTAELATSMPDVAAEARRSYDATAEILTEAIERARREGDVDPGVDADQVAYAVLAAQLGVVALGRTGMGVGALASVAESALTRLLPSPGHE